MKKMYFGVFAAVLATCLSSFVDHSSRYQYDTQVLNSQYVVFQGCCDQRDPSQYIFLNFIPDACPGTNRLCWFRLFDCDNDGDIDVADFYCVFDLLDTDGDGWLDDETEIAGILEKRF